MAAKATRDPYGTTYTIDAAPAFGKRPACPAVEIWWSRDGAKSDETLILRQEHPNRATAEVIEITFGQLYDLIDACNKAVEHT